MDPGTVPREMTAADIRRVIGDFARAAERCLAAGVDMIHLHGAHGYLLGQFLSPQSNRRTDGYGGSLANRARFPLEVLAAVRQVVDRNGRVDILINNAGLFAGIARRPFWEIDLAEWRRVMEVNVDSIFLLCRAVLEPMKAVGGGRVVNLSSNVITFGMADLMHYVASKGAVSVMTRSLAREMGPFGIAVNAVGPGLVTTEVTTAEISETYLRLVAEGQMLTQPIFPADIADAVAFLASPAGRMITGQTLFVNGGATAGGV